MKRLNDTVEPSSSCADLRAIAAMSFRRRAIVLMTLLAAGAVLWWMICVTCYMARKVPQGDEVDFLLAHTALSRTGNTGFVTDSLGDLSTGHWHTPLFNISVQPFMALGLNALTATYALNLMCGMGALALTGVLGFRMGRLAALPRPAWCACGAIVLLATVPLFQAGTGLVDIDNGILTFWITLYLTCLLWTPAPKKVGCDVLLGVILGAAFLTKLTTTMVLLPTTVIYLFTSGQARTSIRRIATIGSVAAVVFGAVFLMTRPYFGGEWYEPFAHIARMLEQKTTVRTWRSGGLRTLGELLLWISPASIVLLCVSILSGLHRKGAIRCRPQLLTLCFFVSTVWIVHARLGVTFNLRYMIPTLPALAVLGSLLTWRSVRVVPRNISLAWTIGFGLLLLATVTVLHDPLLHLKTYLKYESVSQSCMYLGSLVAILLAVALVVYWGWRTGIVTQGRFVVMLLVFHGLFNVNTSLEQLLGDYDLGYAYGRFGFQEAYGCLRQHTGEETPIIAPEAFLWLYRDTDQTIYRDVHLVDAVKKHGERPCYLVLEHRNSRLGDEHVKGLLRRSDVLFDNGELAVVYNCSRVID